MKYYMEHNGEVFVKLHYLQIMISLFPAYIADRSLYKVNDSDENRGIYQSQLNQLAAHYLCNIECYNTKIYIDFERIYRIDRNTNNVLKESILSLIQKGNTIVFINVGESIANITQSIIDSNQDSVLVNCKKDLYTSSVIDNMRDELVKCKEVYGKQSPSSKVKLPVFINIKKIIEQPSLFSQAIYVLSKQLVKEKVLSFDHPEENKDTVFMAHTMNGSAIAGMLSQFFSMDTITIDHLGPKNDIFINEFSSKIQKRKKYITVSDVICMGREVSDAKTILQLSGGECTGSITLVNIVPIGEKEKDIHCLINITKDDNFLGYHIETDL